MHEELKGCPFCDGEAQVNRYGNSSGTASYSVWCKSCSNGTTWAHGETEDIAKARAIAAWNRRTPVSGEVAEGVAVAWRRADGGEFNLTDDPEVAAYWTRKGCAVTPLVAQGIDHAKLADDTGEAVAAFDHWMKRRGPLGAGAGPERPFLAGWCAARQARGQQAGGAGVPANAEGGEDGRG